MTHSNANEGRDASAMSKDMNTNIYAYINSILMFSCNPSKLPLSFLPDRHERNDLIHQVVHLPAHMSALVGQEHSTSSSLPSTPVNHRGMTYLIQ